MLRRRPLPLLLLLFGITLTISGIVLTPPIIAKYLKHVEVLSETKIVKVVIYQLFLIIFGFIIISASNLFIKWKHAKFHLTILFIFLCGLFLNNLYKNCINIIYPNNIILKSSEKSKVLSLLLGKDILLSDYQPKSVLVVNNRSVMKAKYPVIDIHFNFKSLTKMNAEELVRAMDACGVEKVVDMGGSQEEFEGFIKNFRDKYPDRFILFTRLNLNQIKKPNFPEEQLEVFDNAIRMGAMGLKVIKSLGLEIKDRSGQLVHVDDPRFDPIWDKAGKSGIPVLMHLGDPTPFFAPVDRYNERYEELKDFPHWSFHGPRFQTKEAIRSQRENLVKKHPRTIFIMAHMGDDVENLSSLASLFDKYPNYYVDLSARLPELGRQPYTSREFFIKYQDRILFGSDGGYALDPNGYWTAERHYRTYFEFLETRNEYFEYPLWGVQKQGRWRIYGIDLPDEVLIKIYYKNAEKILFQRS